MLEIRKFILNK